MPDTRDPFDYVNKAQKLALAVEEWQDDCDHTMDEPEDCEQCTRLLVDTAAEITGVSQSQRDIIRTFLVKYGIYEHSEELFDALYKTDS